MIIKDNALVIDLDDTLYNEIEYLKSSYIEIAKDIDSFLYKDIYEKMFQLYQSGDNVFKYLSDKYKKKSIQELLELYRNHKPNIKLFDYVSDCLDFLENEYSFAIITDGRSITQRNKIKALGLDHYLTKIIISEELGSEKPNVENFKSVEEELKCKKYFYIGDNVKKDFITPKKMGWITICLMDNGYNIHKQNFNVDSQFLPDFYFNSWLEIFDFFKVR